MEGRIVISFRAPAGPGRAFPARARALEARARPHGGQLVAWDGSRVAFAFHQAKLAGALALLTARGEDTAEGEPPWSAGIAQGELSPLAEDGSRGELAWGPPLVSASLLASVAEPGEILCAESVRALRSGELLGAGSRVGRDGTLRVRGVRLDATNPWRSHAVEQLAHMRVAPRVGPQPPAAAPEPGSLLVLRADPGTGGSRFLTDLARRSRALVVQPSGSSFEPLGALRRALARSLTRELSPLLLELARPLDSLLAGNGVSLEVAAKLITAFLWPRSDAQPPGLLLLDDAKSVDPATLEACVRAGLSASATFGLVARLDATGSVPSVLAALDKTTDIELAPLGREAAESLAGGCTNEALDEVARRRWARLGGHVPLAVVEAVAYGIASGDLRWTGDKASPRSRVSGRGKVRGAPDWILLRARDERAPARTLLCLIAMLGGEAKVTRLTSILERAAVSIDVDAVLEELIRGRWLFDTQEDWVGLPSRTHRDALSTLLEVAEREPIHRASAEIIQEEEGVFGRVEAAWHAAQAGDGPGAARILLAAARATAEARLEASTTQLIAFARRADPTCEEAALELLANALERAPSLPPVASGGQARALSAPPPRSRSAAPARSAPPPAPTPPLAPPAPKAAAPGPVEAEDLAPFEVDTTHDSEPPTIAKMDLAPMSERDILSAVEPAQPFEPVDPVESSEGDEGTSAADAADAAEAGTGTSGANIATRLGELAKEALLSADNAALERWVDGLRAAGESPMFTERLRALSRLGRGDIGDALRVLRRTRSALDPKDHKLRCQTSLALGVALSVAGRPQEALLEGMDALARARHVGDERGADACLAFLSKLYASQGREEAPRLR